MREIYPSSFLNIRRIIDEAECYQVIRDIRLPDGIRCPHCDSQKLIKHGKDDTQLSRQKWIGFWDVPQRPTGIAPAARISS